MGVQLWPSTMQGSVGAERKVRVKDFLDICVQLASAGLDMKSGSGIWHLECAGVGAFFASEGSLCDTSCIYMVEICLGNSASLMDI